MKCKYFFLSILYITSFSFSQTVIDDFTNGNFSSNPTWSGNTTEFSVLTNTALPNGSASTDGAYLASNVSQGDVSLAFASTEVSEWRFSLASTNFNLSGSNYIGVVLMASTSFSGDLINDGVTNNFKGYYLRIGDNDNDFIELWRKTGVGETMVGNFPNSPSFSTGALQDGLNIRVTRSSIGVFELFYSIGFQYNSFPTISAGRVTSNVYSTSNYFGVFQNIGNKSTSRRIYIDNIQLGVVTWNGSTSNNWATAANWDTNLTPTLTDNIIIPSALPTYPTTSNSVTVNSVILNNGTSLIAQNTFTGLVTYYRNVDFISGNLKGWFLMSSPVAGETYNNEYNTANSIASNGSNKGIATYNTSSDSWNYLQNMGSGTFNKGQGYSIKRGVSTGNVGFTGTLNTDNSGVAITLITTGNRFNLLGNPYTSYIPSATFLNNESAISNTKTLWLWNQTLSTNGAYEVKDINDAISIAPGQGFFVKANISGGTFNFTKSNQIHNGTDTFQKNNNPIVKLWIKDGTIKNYCRIKYLNNATTGYDNGYEGELFAGKSNKFAIYSHLISDNQGKSYQSQSLPNSNYENMTVPVGVNATSGKELTFSAEVINLPSGIKVYLEDKKNNSFTRLDESNSQYKITLTNHLNGIGRFYLHTTASVLNTPIFDMELVNIYTTSTTNLKIIGVQKGKASIDVFNILGKKVHASSFTAKSVNNINLPVLKTGIYIVQLTTEYGKVNKKIVII